MTLDPPLLDRAVQAYAEARGLTLEEARAHLLRMAQELDGKGESAVEVVKGTEDTAYQYSSKSWKQAFRQRRRSRKAGTPQLN